MAVRRAVVTPTFAAGLGVVIVAVLAYPMTRTVFRYSAPAVHPCQVKGCGVDAQGDAPSLASAKPGQPLVVPTLDVRTPAPEPRSAPSGPPATAHPGRGNAKAAQQDRQKPGGGPAVVGFQVLSQGSQSFTAELFLPAPGTSAPGGQASTATQLELSFPWQSIIYVWGATLVQQGPGTALLGTSGEQSSPGQAGTGIVVEAAGPAAPPSGCVLDGQKCQVQVVGGQQGGGSGGG